MNVETCVYMLCINEKIYIYIWITIQYGRIKIVVIWSITFVSNFKCVLQLLELMKIWVHKLKLFSRSDVYIEYTQRNN